MKKGKQIQTEWWKQITPINLSLGQPKWKLRQYNFWRDKVESNCQSLRNAIIEILDALGGFKPTVAFDMRLDDEIYE